MGNETLPYGGIHCRHLQIYSINVLLVPIIHFTTMHRWGNIYSKDKMGTAYIGSDQFVQDVIISIYERKLVRNVFSMEKIL